MIENYDQQQQDQEQNQQYEQFQLLEQQQQNQQFNQVQNVQFQRNIVASEQEGNISGGKIENLSENEREQLRVIMGNLQKDLLRKQYIGQFQAQQQIQNQLQSVKSNKKIPLNGGLVTSQYFSPQRGGGGNSQQTGRSTQVAQNSVYPRNYENWVIRQSLSPRRGQGLEQPAQGQGFSNQLYRSNMLEEVRGCTFEPMICEKSSKIAPRDQNLKKDEYMVNYLYGDALKRLQKEQERKQAVVREENQSMVRSKMDYKSQKIVYQRIQEQLQNLLSDLDEVQKDRVSFESVGLYLENLGLFKQLQFKKDKNNQTSLFLSDRARSDPLALQKEMSFHEFFWHILTLSNNRDNYNTQGRQVQSFQNFQNLGQVDSFKNEDIQREGQNQVQSKGMSQGQGEHEEGGVFQGEQKNEGDIQSSASKELIFDMTMILMEKKLEVRKAVSMLREVIGSSLGCDDLEEVLSEQSLRQLVRDFRYLMDDNSALMTWYSTKKVHLLQDLNFVAASAAEDKFSSPQKEFNPTINARSKKEGGQYLARKMKLTEVPKTRVELLFQHGSYIDKKIQEKKQEETFELQKKCPFKPEINPPREIPEFNEQQEFDNTQQDRFTKLYYDHFAIEQKIKDKKQYVEEQKKNLELEGCTFKPIITTMPDHKFYQTVNNKTFACTNIKGTTSMIERYQKAREDKTLLESFWDNKNKSWQNKDMSKVTYTQPFSFLQREKSFRDKKEPQTIVEVNLSKNKKGKILVYPGDDPATLALNFSKVYSLNDEMRNSLTEMLASHLKDIQQTDSVQNSQFIE